MAFPSLRVPAGTSLSPGELLKCRFYLVLLSVLVLAGLTSLLLFTEGYFFDRVLSPLLLLTLAGFTARLWYHPPSLRTVERGVTLAITLGYALILTHTLYVSGEVGVREEFINIFRLWGPLIYLWSFLALGKRRGLAASFAFYLSTLLLSLPYFLLYPPEDALFGGRYLLGDFYLASLAYLAGLYAFATFLERQAEERLRAESLARYAYIDALTELPNRRHLNETLERALGHSSGPIGVLFIDLNDFKAINDRWGHHAGDALLVAVAARLKNCVRREDTLARLGGDEFAVVLPGLRHKEDAGEVAREILKALTDPFELPGVVASVTASVGVSLYPQDGTSAEGLLVKADRAMYRAKVSGKSGCCEEVGEALLRTPSGSLVRRSN